MASSTVKRPLCKECNKASSAFFCQGCKKDFCTGHAKEHRQELSKQLDTIILEHDQLKQNLTECTEKSNQHPLMKKIDQWEIQSIDKIRKAADDARKTLSTVADGCRTKIKVELQHLTQELKTARSEDNFIEIDLQEWTKKLKKWVIDLNTSTSINIQQEKNDTPFIQKIIVNCIGNSNEFFERSTKKLKIDDHGQVVFLQSRGHSTVRCHSEYSSGQHQFRFKIEEMDARDGIYFGIVSKNIPLQETTHSTPTTFGWISHGRLIRNGCDVHEGNEHQCNMVKNDTIEVFLDCDQQIIRLTNTRTNSTSELKVDVNQCPFPWQMHIGLYYENDRVRFLPK
jgi:hypothetical protein